MSWLSSLFSGNKQVANAASNMMTQGQSLMGTGMGDIGQAGNFFNKILQGGATSVLAPEISAAEKQKQQQTQALSQFGTRSGGTAAAEQAAGDVTRGNIQNIIANLMGSSAQSLGSLGLGAFGAGSGAAQSGAQLQLQNKSLFSSLLQDAGQAAGGIAGMWAGKKLFG